MDTKSCKRIIFIIITQLHVKVTLTNLNIKNNILRLDIEFPYQNFSLKTLSQRCLKYHIAYIRNGTIIAKNCIKNNPFWMGDNLSSIGHKALVNIVIPGTHDAGSYDKYNYTNDNRMIENSKNANHFLIISFSYH